MIHTLIKLEHGGTIGIKETIDHHGIAIVVQDHGTVSGVIVMRHEVEALIQALTAELRHLHD
jgi:hypothetical protein